MEVYSELAKILEGFDRTATVDYYKDQLTAKENCTCMECAYFQDVFIKKELELFSFLTELGIDLQKEQGLDPDGLWIILDDNNEFDHCLTSHVVFGDFSEITDNDLLFEFEEKGVKINLQVYSDGEEARILFLEFNSIKT